MPEFLTLRAQIDQRMAISPVLKWAESPEPTHVDLDDVVTSLSAEITFLYVYLQRLASIVDTLAVFRGLQDGP